MKVVSIYLVSGLAIRVLAEEDRAEELTKELLKEGGKSMVNVSDSLRVNTFSITHIEVTEYVPEAPKEEVVPEIV